MKNTQKRKQTKNQETMTRLMATLFDELGVDARLPSGAVIPVLFQANDTAYELSHSELMATTGLMEVAAERLAAHHLTPTIGLVLRLEDQAFKVMTEPRFDVVSDTWQFRVMAQENEESAHDAHHTTPDDQHRTGMNAND